MHQVPGTASNYPAWITVIILELIHDTQLRPSGKSAFVRTRPIQFWLVIFVNLNHSVLIAWPRAYQLSMVRAMPTMVVTGNDESGFDSGEGA